MKKLFLFCLALVLVTFNIYSTIKNVPSEYSTIQAAINASVNGDTILVAQGTYFENLNYRGKNIVLTSTYYQTGDPAVISSTIINGSTPTHPDTISCVIISNHEDSTAVLQGFTITGGRGTLWDDEHSPGNRFREGGGVLIQYSSPVIQNNVIRNNDAINDTGIAYSAGGGGIRMGDSNPKILNNIIMQNRGLYGAGIVLNYSAGIFKNNIICLNSGASQFGGGGAFWILSVSPLGPRIIENNTIINNAAIGGTGGILVQGSSLSIRNNIVRGNISPGNTQFSGVAAGQVTYCNVQNGFSGAGNIDVDPLFADSNYILQSGSPCVDKGDSSTQYNDLPDPNNGSIAKYPSHGGLRNDMGAYGGPLARLLTTQLIGIPNIGTETPVKFELYQNYPNPFNPSTSITFDIPKGEFTKLTIYDILGREILILVNEFKSSGRYSVNFNAAALSSGVYFYTLKSGNIIVTKKMILNK